jgi:hypothetical protein
MSEHHHDAPAVEHRLGFDRRRPVGCLHDERGGNALAHRGVDAPPNAAGTSSSQSMSQMASPLIGSRPNPATVPVSDTWSDSAPMSRPPSLSTAPPTSLTATTRMPAELSRKASGASTLPKPWRTARLPTKGRPSFAEATRAQARHPDEVAPSGCGCRPATAACP